MLGVARGVCALSVLHPEPFTLHPVFLVHQLLANHVAEDSRAFVFWEGSHLSADLEFALFAPLDKLLVCEVVQPLRDGYPLLMQRVEFVCVDHGVASFLEREFLTRVSQLIDVNT